MKFKVGDEVKSINSENLRFWKQQNKHGIVKNIIGPLINVKFYEKGGEFSFYETELTKEKDNDSKSIDSIA